MGIPAADQSAGTLMQGTCKAVHMRLNVAIPCVWSPSGAMPGALKVRGLGFRRDEAFLNA